MTGEIKSSGIEMGEDYEHSPEIVCPHCSGILHLRLDGFKPDITKIVRSNCANCGGEIYACLLILTDLTLNGVVSSAQAVTEMFKEEKRKLISNPRQ